VSYQYYDSLGEDTNSTVISPIVSYQFYDSLIDTGTNSVIVSPIASYQYFDSLDSTEVKFLNSPFVSYFYQIGNGATLIVMQGTVTDPTGTGIPGATVKASVSLAVVAQATTDASGHYALPALGAGVYVLQVSEATHASAARALTLNAATATENFQLTVLPSAPPVQQTTRQPDVAFTPPAPGSQGEKLLVFDDTTSTFVDITANNAPATDRMTIVLTHGWIPPWDKGDPQAWQTGMAKTLRASGVTANIANIVSWDWRQVAAAIAPPAESTPSEGEALGRALQSPAVLGTDYAQPVHFIGHSLGPMVNAAAANYVHSNLTAQQKVSSTPWINSATYVTLFDEAEIAQYVDLGSSLFSVDHRYGLPI